MVADRGIEVVKHSVVEMVWLDLSVYGNEVKHVVAEGGVVAKQL